MNIQSIKAGRKTIKLISEAGKKLDTRIHEVGVAGVAHFLQHGDTTLISELVHAMPRSARGNALKFWITKHLKTVKWDAKACGGLGGYKGKMLTNEDGLPLHSFAKIHIIKQAMAMPFYEKEDKEASVWNEGKNVANFLKVLKGHDKKGEVSSEGKALMRAAAAYQVSISRKESEAA